MLDDAINSGQKREARRIIRRDVTGRFMDIGKLVNYHDSPDYPNPKDNDSEDDNDASGPSSHDEDDSHQGADFSDSDKHDGGKRNDSKSEHKGTSDEESPDKSEKHKNGNDYNHDTICAYIDKFITTGHVKKRQ